MSTTAKGSSGTVEFDGETVRIRRAGLLAKLSAGTKDKTIPLAQVSAVEYTPPTRVTTGVIRFVHAGMQAPQARPVAQQSILAGGGDPDAVAFSRKHVEDFDRLRKVVESALADRTTCRRG